MFIDPGYVSFFIIIIISTRKIYILDPGSDGVVTRFLYRLILEPLGKKTLSRR